jgi:phosphoribosylaminoimidazole-succinocarboxamide synthase
MKSYKEIEKKYNPEEIAESLVSPGTKDPEERKEILLAFSEIRKQQKEKQTEKSKLISRLIQLKFLIEDYLKADGFN